MSSFRDCRFSPERQSAFPACRVCGRSMACTSNYCASFSGSCREGDGQESRKMGAKLFIRLPRVSIARDKNCGRSRTTKYLL